MRNLNIYDYYGSCQFLLIYLSKSFENMKRQLTIQWMLDFYLIIIFTVSGSTSSWSILPIYFTEVLILLISDAYEIDIFSLLLWKNKSKMN